MTENFERIDVGNELRFVRVEIHWPPMVYQPKTEATVKVDGVEVEEDKRTKPKLKLYSNSEELKFWRDRFQKADSTKSSLINSHSTKNRIFGRTVPREAFPTLLQKLVGPYHKDRESGRIIYEVSGDSFAGYDLNSCLSLSDLKEVDFLTWAANQSVGWRINFWGDQFARRYLHIMDEIKSGCDSDAIWQQMASKIPAPDQIRSRFGLDVDPQEIRLGGDGNTGAAGLEDVAEFQDFFHASMESRVTSLVEDIVDDVSDGLAEALERLYDLIQRDGCIKSNSFNGINTAIEKALMFRQFSSTQLLEMVNRFQGRINNLVPKDLNKTLAEQNGLTSAIETLQSEVTDAARRQETISRVGRAARTMSFG